MHVRPYHLTGWRRGTRTIGGSVRCVEGPGVGGMAFGIRAPTVVLWGGVDPSGVLWIVDERVVVGADLVAGVKVFQPLRMRWAAGAVDASDGGWLVHTSDHSRRSSRTLGFA